MLVLHLLENAVSSKITLELNVLFRLTECSKSHETTLVSLSDIANEINKKILDEIR